MKSFEIDGVKIEVYGESGMSEQAARGYLADAQRGPNGKRVERVSVKVMGDDAELTVAYSQPRKFCRIRRVTGYLTGSVDTWNGAKQAELADRIKHM